MTSFNSSVHFPMRRQEVSDQVKTFTDNLSNITGQAIGPQARNTDHRLRPATPDTPGNPSNSPHLTQDFSSPAESCYCPARLLSGTSSLSSVRTLVCVD
ncbi:hypothetical protein DPMN_017369 [Dreissena polymorpha]|uniref:Uncharacterized protein n=1 Tax=Dreissena polymorpha TaxID=45954 RepID=A0A9D4ND27_DREPO|nr:hypothetical protein DPMN_017369 [Dreissena polymorpha]